MEEIKTKKIKKKPFVICLWTFSEYQICFRFDNFLLFFFFCLIHRRYDKNRQDKTYDETTTHSWRFPKENNIKKRVVNCKIKRKWRVFVHLCLSARRFSSKLSLVKHNYLSIVPGKCCLNYINLSCLSVSCGSTLPSFFMEIGTPFHGTSRMKIFFEFFVKYSVWISQYESETSSRLIWFLNLDASAKEMWRQKVIRPHLFFMIYK